MDAKLEAEAMLLHRHLRELGEEIEEKKAELIQIGMTLEQAEERAIKEIERLCADKGLKLEGLAREYIEKINELANSTKESNG
ncbi:hypothetical protein ES705_33446 [subsurface metagenome]|jgi:hypothetical protein